MGNAASFPCQDFPNFLIYGSSKKVLQAVKPPSVRARADETCLAHEFDGLKAPPVPSSGPKGSLKLSFDVVILTGDFQRLFRKGEALSYAPGKFLHLAMCHHPESVLTSDWEALPVKVIHRLQGALRPNYVIKVTA